MAALWRLYGGFGVFIHMPLHIREIYLSSYTTVGEGGVLFRKKLKILGFFIFLFPRGKGLFIRQSACSCACPA